MQPICKHPLILGFSGAPCHTKSLLREDTGGRAAAWRTDTAVDMVKVPVQERLGDTQTLLPKFPSRGEGDCRVLQPLIASKATLYTLLFRTLFHLCSTRSALFVDNRRRYNDAFHAHHSECVQHIIEMLAPAEMAS